MTEKEKMIKGMIYDSSDEELAMERNRAHRQCAQFNKIEDDGDPQKRQIIDLLIPDNGGVYLQGPIFFDYGWNTTFGHRCYGNYNLCVLDVCPVTIGDDVMMGCNVSLMTPIHPLLFEERKQYVNAHGKFTDREYAKPIVIEAGCWIASNVVICGGVTIGSESVIGAGSVVTKDIPRGVLAAGNPCRVIRKITAEDSIYCQKDLLQR